MHDEDIDVAGVAGNLRESSTEKVAVVEKEFLRLSLCPRCNKPAHFAHELLVTGHQEELVGSVELCRFTISGYFNFPECRKGKDPCKEMVTDPCIIQAQFIFYGQLGKPFQYLTGKKPAVFSIAMDFSADGYTRTPLVPEVGEPPFKIKPSTGGRESRNRLAKAVISR